MATDFAMPEALRESIRAIAEKFGVPDRQVSVAPRQGQVNLTIFLGDDLVLRLPRKPRFEQEVRPEPR